MSELTVVSSSCQMLYRCQKLLRNARKLPSYRIITHGYFGHIAVSASMGSLFLTVFPGVAKFVFASAPVERASRVVVIPRPT